MYPWWVGETDQGSNPHIGAYVWDRQVTFEAESEAADLQQAKWNETHTISVAAIWTGTWVPKKAEQLGAGA